MVGPGPALGRAPDAPFQAGELGLLFPPLCVPVWQTEHGRWMC